MAVGAKISVDGLTEGKESFVRKVYVGLMFVLVLAIVAQFYFAGVGAFDTGPRDDAFSVHRMLGYIIFLIALLATIAAAVARLPGRIIGLTGLVTGLILLQSVIAQLAKAFDDAGDTSTTAGTIVFGLHALNALAIMGASGTALRLARGQTAKSQTDPAAAGAAARTEPPAAS